MYINPFTQCRRHICSLLLPSTWVRSSSLFTIKQFHFYVLGKYIYEIGTLEYHTNVILIFTDFWTIAFLIKSVLFWKKLGITKYHQETINNKFNLYAFVCEMWLILLVLLLMKITKKSIIYKYILQVYFIFMYIDRNCRKIWYCFFMPLWGTLVLPSADHPTFWKFPIRYTWLLI